MSAIYTGIVTDENGQLLDNIKTGLNRYLVERESDGILKEFEEKVFVPFLYILTFQPPEKWVRSIYKQMLILDRDVELDPRIRSYLDQYFPSIREILYIPKQHNIPQTIIYAVNKIGQSLPEAKIEVVEIRYISMLEICQKIPTANLTQKDDIDYLIIDNLYGKKITIPLMTGVYHKGGIARLILKFYFDSPWLKSEVPIKDWDILVQKLRTGKRFLEIAGETDQSGIEVFSSCFESIMYSRDVTLNQCLLGKNGLWYTPEAESAVKTGVIFPCSGDHGLYGCDFFMHQGHRFVKGRVFERLIKTVIEKKAKVFDIRLDNLQVFMGISGLIGALRKIDSSSFVERLMRFYYMLEQLGQIDMYRYLLREKHQLPCNSIFDYLEGIHTMYPFVLFRKLGEDEGVARWLMEKLLKWHERDFKNTFGLSSGDLCWIKFDQEERMVRFDLTRYQSDQQLANRLEQWLPGFIERCQRRNEQYYSQHRFTPNKK